ncbi:MAG TPA: hypothetical protein VFC19_37150 [Candidatus Limnocylindrales bacterium]|nr:hypothetical protein [Candidatus Limnocylindrales bacterium]
MRARAVAEQWKRSGTISSGTGGPATIVMNFDGGVVEARLHSQWRRKLGFGDLGAAVVSAVREAQRLVSASEMPERPRVAEAAPSQPSPAPEVAVEASTDEFASYLRTLLVDVQAVLPQVAAETLHAAREEVTVKGANGAVIATVRGGHLVRMICARTWVARTGQGEIGRVLTDVPARALPGGMARVTARMAAVGRRTGQCGWAPLGLAVWAAAIAFVVCGTMLAWQLWRIRTRSG